MSPMGALVVAITALILLAGVAAWMMNVPIWAIGLFVALAGWLSISVIRRFHRRRTRQETESPV
jgi:membrane protein implicated in regulation of membrane protease activity